MDGLFSQEMAQRGLGKSEDQNGALGEGIRTPGIKSEEGNYRTATDSLFMRKGSAYDLGWDGEKRQ